MKLFVGTHQQSSTSDQSLILICTELKSGEEIGNTANQSSTSEQSIIGNKLHDSKEIGNVAK